MKVYAVAEKVSRLCRYIVPGKKYPVLSENLTEFLITDEDGDAIYCLWESCSHTGGSDWSRVVEMSKQEQREEALKADAPALLDALESVISEAIDEYYEATDPDGIISKARALIAKHRGGV